jgi:hypothetical protein
MKTILLSLALFACVAGDNVYICTGPHARRYHKSATCKGLRNCSCEIKQVSLEKAKKMHKTPCHICCKNDCQQ